MHPSRMLTPEGDSYRLTAAAAVCTRLCLTLIRLHANSFTFVHFTNCKRVAAFSDDEGPRLKKEKKSRENKCVCMPAVLLCSDKPNSMKHVTSKCK